MEIQGGAAIYFFWEKQKPINILQRPIKAAEKGTNSAVFRLSTAPWSPPRSAREPETGPKRPGGHRGQEGSGFCHRGIVCSYRSLCWCWRRGGKKDIIPSRQDVSTHPARGSARAGVDVGYGCGNPLRERNFDFRRGKENTRTPEILLAIDFLLPLRQQQKI